MPDDQGLPTNKDRAARGGHALAQYMGGSELQVADLLADLMHWCNLVKPDGTDFDEQLDRARRIYEGDLEEERD